MLKPFIDHSFTKIGDYSASREFSITVAREKLAQLESTLNKFSSNGLAEEGENILDYQNVKRALEQCLRHIVESDTAVTIEDHSIYYDYAYGKLKAAESIIDAEYDELGL